MKPVLKELARGVLARLPAPVQHGLVERYACSRIRAMSALRTPTSLIFFITNRCNERCGHCFYWKDLNTHTAELTIEEIETLVTSLDKPVSLALTGGEPFIRKDLPEIARLFNRINGCRVIGISTNATLADRIMSGCKEILETCDLDRFGVQISLDGLRETHDRIRKIPRAFERTLGVMEELIPLKERFPSFRPTINCCIQRDNIDEIEGFVRAMRRFDIPIRFAIIRGNAFGTYGLAPEVQAGVGPKDVETAALSADELEQAFRLIAELDRGPVGGFWTDMEKLKIEASLRMIKTGQRQVDCYNGRMEAIIYPQGNLAMCELTRPIGNLRDFDMDMARIWKSEAAEHMRGPISRCHCIHGCSLVTSIGLQPEMLLKKILDRPLAM